MPMHRDILKQYLRAGPSRRFDVAHFSHKLPKDAPASAYLFANAFLNNAILFKYMDLDQRRAGAKGPLINTLIYLPYDNENPGEGGESVLFCKENLQQLCEYKVSANAVDSRRLATDVEKLTVLDSLPTFSPFIVELAFQRSGLGVPDCYLQLTPEVRATLNAHLMGRLRPLIVARCQAAADIEKSVEDLTTKLFRLREPNDALPLIEALRLPPEIAQEVLSSWVGIAYFEYEYANLQPKLRRTGQLVGGASHPVGRANRFPGQLNPPEDPPRLERHRRHLGTVSAVLRHDGFSRQPGAVRRLPEKLSRQLLADGRGTRPPGDDGVGLATLHPLRRRAQAAVVATVRISGCSARPDARRRLARSKSAATRTLFEPAPRSEPRERPHPALMPPTLGRGGRCARR